MDLTPSNDDDDGAGAAKLIPEWSVAADDQIVFAGMAVVGFLALALGWNAFFGGDDDNDSSPITTLAAEVAAPADDLGETAGPAIAAAVGTDDEEEEVAEEATTTTVAATTTTAPASTTTVASIGDVQAVVTPLDGDITGTADGTVAVLTGFVANDAESREAEEAAAEVEGITEVRNELVLLEPAVTDALSDAGVAGATAIGRGTSITVSGTIDTEDDRQPALDAAEAVTGVTEVIDDRLNVSVTADLNALPQVQFATASAEILPQSFADLDAAAELITEAGDITLEVQGYTDVQGDDDRNQVLSQARASSVRDYLIGAGVDADTLTAAGYGETEEFGPDLASNRVVRFQQVDG